LVPKTQRLIPLLQAKRTTGTPAICNPRLASSEKAAFRLIPVRRVEALKKATGLGIASLIPDFANSRKGEDAFTWRAR
jgi:hypothetical protein